jgi:hypothetical protein
VFVVVAVVARVPVTVMDIVHVVVVRHRHVPATLAVGVVGMVVCDVLGGLALVPVSLVATVQVAVVHEIDVVGVQDDHVTAAFAMNMLMLRVFEVCGGHRRTSSGADHRTTHTNICMY